MGGRRFTRISDDGLKFSKLDRFFVTDDFCVKWRNLAVVSLDRKLSDHCPILLKDMDMDFGMKPFRAYDVWLKENDIDSVFISAWNNPVLSYRADCVMRDKFKNVKERLKEWNKLKVNANNTAIEKCKSEAMKWEIEAESRVLESREMELWLKARKEWIEKDNEKVSMLKQKARIKWDVEGDENSKYFHAMIKRRNNKNRI